MAKIPCPQCEKLFKGEGGLKWHLEHIHEVLRQNGAQGTHQDDAGAALPDAEAQDTTLESADQRQGAEDVDATSDSLLSGEEVPEPQLVMLDGLSRRIEGLEAQVAHLPQVQQLVEGLFKDRGSVRQYDAEAEKRLRAVCRILRKLENPERTGFASIADDSACGISLEEARGRLELASMHPAFTVRL